MNQLQFRFPGFNTRKLAYNKIANGSTKPDSYPVATYLFLFALEYGKAINAHKAFGTEGEKPSQFSSVLPLMHRKLIKSYP